MRRGEAPCCYSSSPLLALTLIDSLTQRSSRCSGLSVSTRRTCTIPTPSPAPAAPVAPAAPAPAPALPAPAREARGVRRAACSAARSEARISASRFAPLLMSSRGKSPRRPCSSLHTPNPGRLFVLCFVFDGDGEPRRTAQTNNLQIISYLKLLHLGRYLVGGRRRVGAAAAERTAGGAGHRRCVVVQVEFKRQI